MKTTGKVLIIDDSPTFLKDYENRLGDEGYVVEAAQDRTSAIQKLDSGVWDVVLLDQKLEGPGGSDSGLDLISEIARRAPGAKTILVTAYATTAAIRRAFREGVYDYLQKDEFFSTFLAAKLRNAMEVVRAQRFSGLTHVEAEAEIADTWKAVQTETDSNRKGTLLENLMVLLVQTIPGFRNAATRRKNEMEEIDVVVRNESTDPLWSTEGAYILFECKNWSKPVGASELRNFLGKIERRYDRCKLGFFVAPGGFTEPLKSVLLTEMKGNKLVVILDTQDLAGFITSKDRNETLKQFHQRAVIEMNGH